MKDFRIMGPLFKSRAFMAAFVVVGALSLFCVTQELSARPGYESSLILSPFMALMAGIAAIGIVRKIRDQVKTDAIRRAVASTALSGALLAAFSFVLLSAGAALRGACDFSDGAAFYMVGPLCCTAAASCLGFVIAWVTARARAAYTTWALLVLGSLFIDFLEFYTTPKVNVYDHLLGYFAGPLWDEAVKVDARLWLFRGITLAGLACIMLVFLAGFSRGGAAFSWKRIFASWRGRLSVLLLAAVVAGSCFLQTRVGISGSRRTIESRLMQVVQAGDTLVFLPSCVPGREAAWLKQDVMFREWQLQEFFGERPPGTMRLYFFESAGMMKKYTGAGPTSVSKPWLGEAYMVYRRPPHRSLKHELAHLYSALWGSGPLRLPGKLWGMASDPVILEGTAVAADWNGDPASPHATCAAGIRAGLLKTWDPFSSLGFFDVSSGLSYEASGSFVRYVRDTWGTGALAKWYGGAGFEDAAGVSEKQAAAKWRQFIAGLDVAPQLISDVKRLYGAPSIFERTCPHAVANLYEEAGTCAGRGDIGGVLEAFSRIEHMDGKSRIHVLRRIRFITRACMATGSDLTQLLEEAQLKKDRPLDIFSLAGDIAWAAGNNQMASGYFSAALEHAGSDYDRRLLAIKKWAAGTEEGLSRSFRNYFVCSRDDYPKTPLSQAAGLLDIIEMHPHLAVTYYLFGRVMLGEGRPETAASTIDKALRIHEMNDVGPLPRTEALLVLAECSLRLEDGREKALQAMALLEKEKNLSHAQAFRLSELEQHAEFLQLQ